MKKNKYKTLYDVAKVDLTKHALIEASAGTGKTYMIENLVLRLLIENENIELENILIVTFTEKAASDLKARIWENIVKTARYDQNLSSRVRSKINNTLDIFDQAQIFTIHGFCNTILKDFAFELGLPFDQTLVDDKYIFRDLVGKQIVELWPEIFGKRLDIILTLSDFNSHKSEFISNVIDLAENTNEVILPDCNNINLNHMWTNILSELTELKDLIGTNHKFSKQFANLNINTRSKTALLNNLIIPLEKIIYSFDTYKRDVAVLLPIVKLFKGKVRINNTEYSRLIPKRWLKLGNNIEVCPNLELVDNKLIKLTKYFLLMSNLLTVITVNNLLKDAKLLKYKNGWISYKDMLELTESFLYKKISSSSLSKLRNKYKIAFVDEFQDTDYLQWRIFKKIFLNDNSNEKNSKLFLIGDPKQVIYAFRGADIFTYLLAKKEIERLAAKRLANLYCLGKNWRTVPKLQQTLNYIFSSDHWFQQTDNPKGIEVRYNHVDSPTIDNFSEILTHTHVKSSNGSSLNIIDLTEASSVKGSKHLLAEFICRKIDFLVNNSNIYFFRENVETRLVDYNDICILIRRYSDFSFIEPILIAKKIPYFYHNKVGLFQSIEAQHISVVLHAILEPERYDLLKLALITPFFDIPIEKLDQRTTIPWNHPVNQILKLWVEYTKEKKWSKLFQSIIEDSGFLFRHSNESNWDKIETNTRELFKNLEIIAREANDFFELVQIFDKYMSLPANRLREENIQQIIKTDSQVQVMTIHSSKGLEFPIVFIAGGLTNYSDNKSVNICHEIGNKASLSSCKISKDLTDRTGLEQYLLEKKYEEKFLFYVAMTRASARIYLPYYPMKRNFSWVGPICRFISDSLDSVAKNHSSQNELDIKWCSVGLGNNEIQLPTKHKQNYKLNNQFECTSESFNFVSNKNFRARTIILESFSSIIKKTEELRYGNKPEYEKLVLPQVRKQKKQLSPLKSIENLEKKQKIDILPGGPKIGSMFHSILECISFSQVINNPDEILSVGKSSRSIIKKFMRTYGVNEFWLESISNIIVNTLTTPIRVNNDFISLGQLPKNSRKHEVEFYFPVSQKNGKYDKRKNTLEEAVSKEKFIHGFIDMLFKFRNKIYIVDWKSNRLDNLYDQSSLESSMIESGYNIQYKIYTAAVIKWMKQIMGSKFSLYQHFGGVFYLYLRGMKAGTQDGIHYIDRNNIEDIEELEQKIIYLTGTHKISNMV